MRLNQVDDNGLNPIQFTYPMLLSVILQLLEEYDDTNKTVDLEKEN